MVIKLNSLVILIVLGITINSLNLNYFIFYLTGIEAQVISLFITIYFIITTTFFYPKVFSDVYTKQLRLVLVVFVFTVLLPIIFELLHSADNLKGLLFYLKRSVLNIISIFAVMVVYNYKSRKYVRFLGMLSFYLALVLVWYSWYFPIHAGEAFAPDIDLFEGYNVTERSSGPFLNPNAAGFALCVLFLILWFIQEFNANTKKLDLLFKVNIGLFFLTVSMTGSRSSMIIALCIFYFFMQGFFRSLYWFKIIYFIVFFSVMILIAPGSVETFVDNENMPLGIRRLILFGGFDSSDSNMLRLEGLAQTFEVFLENPFLGKGITKLAENVVRSAHNGYITDLARYGLLCGISYLIFLLYFSKVVYKLGAIGYAAIALLTISPLFMDDIMLSKQFPLLFFIVLHSCCINSVGLKSPTS